MDPTPATDRHRNPNRNFRPTPEDWADFGAVASEMGTDRNALMNQWLAWFLRRRKATQPERPTPELMARIVERRNANA